MHLYSMYCKLFDLIIWTHCMSAPASASSLRDARGVARPHKSLGGETQAENAEGSHLRGFPVGVRKQRVWSEQKMRDTNGKKQIRSHVVFGPGCCCLASSRVQPSKVRE